jgi:hypothetical protein
MRAHSVVLPLVAYLQCAVALADHLEFCGPHLRIVEAPNDAKYLPQFPCHTHITSAVVTVHLVVGTDGAIQEARVVGSEVTPVDMESWAADIMLCLPRCGIRSHRWYAKRRFGSEFMAAPNQRLERP